MSRMNELNLTMDELTEVGRQLAACGEALVRAAARVKECFSAWEDGPQAPEAENVSVQETAAPEEPAAKTYTKEEIRAMLADLSQSGFRDVAKALVRKYANGGSLADVDPARYPELAEEAQKYHA